MAPERSSSNQTIIHHDDWSEETPVKAESEVSHTEEDKTEDAAQEEDHDTESEAWPDPTKSELERERQIDRIEAQIQAAARAVVASIEHDNYHGDNSVLSAQTDESYDQDSQLTYGEGTELTYDGTEGTYETEDEHPDHDHDAGGDSSSHHDGDIDDDVFSHSDRSGRSSLNSCSDVHTSDELKDTQGKELTSPVVGEEAATEPVSRIPSAASFTPRDSTPITPSRVYSRPPFRTPSSVRAMQMSSPTPSIFSSPRSTKRHLPTVSRIGTPHSQFSSPSKKTPTRFKAKKEYPLVLLHVTVLPLSWGYSHPISSPDLPPSLQSVKDNWRLLQEKLGDTVLERGILLPHPQDSYEVLEERLLEALELPVRPRARILKCGHYMGPETPMSSSEDERDQYFQKEERKWCDICGREVRIEGILDGKGEQRFRIKIYASNGLMRAGAWAAAWREMERVDVEIEPFVEGGVAIELEHMAASMVHLPPAEEDDGFEDEEEEIVGRSPESLPRAVTPDEERLRRRLMEEERMREIYGPDTPITPTPMERRQRPQQHGSRQVDVEDSLPELLAAALKIAMRDKKNVAIVLLSVLVLLLAIHSGSSINTAPGIIHSAPIPSISSMETVQESVASFVADVPSKMSEVVECIPSKASEVIENSKTTVPTVEIETNISTPEEETIQEELSIPAALPLGKDGMVEEAQSERNPSEDSTLKVNENIDETDNLEEENIPI